MTFTVVYDANVLYPNTLRDLLIRIGQSGIVQAKWTNAIRPGPAGINGRVIAASVQQIADSRISPPEAVEDVLAQLERDCLVESAAALRSI
jgi:hypothetical protein